MSEKTGVLTLPDWNIEQPFTLVFKSPRMIKEILLKCGY